MRRRAIAVSLFLELVFVNMYSLTMHQNNGAIKLRLDKWMHTIVLGSGYLNIDESPVHLNKLESNK